LAAVSTVEELRRGPVAGAIRRARLVCVLRRVEPVERLLALVDDLADAGARIFEITWDAPSAAEDVRALRTHLADRPDEGLLVGGGTILTEDELVAARRSGVDFGVSPVLDVALVTVAVASGLPFIPGAMTPTEVSAAWRAGATFVKVFPASAVGPALVRELRGPFADVELIPTGGIDASNARAFLNAGAVAVGVGGAIVRADGAARADLVRTVGGSA
jgi:2-dehydro-3-deoxyphosphogluconate aldolase/(4S)-4-hydroxy-2-oxoglutarate aldolase